MTQGSVIPIFHLGRIFGITKVQERHFVKDENSGKWQDRTLEPDTKLVVHFGKLRCEITYHR